MKKCKIIMLTAALAIISLSFTSCDKIKELTGKNNTEATPESEAETAEKSQETAALSSGTSSTEAGAGVILQEASLWSNLEKATRKNLAILSIGETVEFTGEAGYMDSDKDKKYPYYKVKRSDGTEGWVYGYYTAPSSTAGVITKESDYYSAPAELISRGTLPAFTIIGISTEPEKSGKKKVSYYHDYGTWGMVESIWLSSGFSDRQDDLLFWAKYTEAKNAYKEKEAAYKKKYADNKAEYDKMLYEAKKELYSALTDVLAEFQAKPVTSDLIDSLNSELDELSQKLSEESSGVGSNESLNTSSETEETAE